MHQIKKKSSASELHKNWDEFTNSYFQTQSFLQHAEKYNHCEQRYYEYYKDGDFVGGAIMYSIRLDLLTYLKIKSPIKMNVVGIPASVSASGVFGDEPIIRRLKNYIYKGEKGLVLFLNLENKPKNTKLASGKTLPTIILKNDFDSWNDYKSKLRANYRRRINQIQTNNNVILKTVACSSFSEQMYEMYLQVFNKSKEKLEKLSFNFFANLPPEFQLTISEKNGLMLGWNITIKHKNFLYFFLGGIDYKFNKENNTYLQLLTNIIRQGIDQKVEYIDLGQTAEIPKMRMGGLLEERFMEGKHSNKFFNKLLKMSEKSLAYNRELEKIAVFKSK